MSEEKKVVLIGGMPINKEKIIKMFSRVMGEGGTVSRRHKSDRKRDRKNRWR